MTKKERVVFDKLLEITLYAENEAKSCDEKDSNYFKGFLEAMKITVQIMLEVDEMEAADSEIFVRPVDKECLC